MQQATKKKIYNEWGKNITVDKSDRKIDFAILTNAQLFLIEVNFYGGSGSKLKSTSGEYKSDFARWKNDGHEFIWITDGSGWKKNIHPLQETFHQIDAILNLDMIEKGLLGQIIAAQQ